MIYQDGLSFVEDADQIELYPYGTTEDYLAIHEMSAHGKEQQYSVFELGYDHTQYMPPSDYESPMTNQNELAALPSNYGSEYDDGYGYGTVQAEYPQVSVPTTTSGNYTTIPSVTDTSFVNQSAVYAGVPNLKKRKASPEVFQGEEPASKRINIQDPSGEYYDLKSEPSPYSSFVPTPTAMPVSHAPYRLSGSPRAHGHQHSTSNASQISLPATAPYTPTVSPSFTTANTEHSPRAPATPGIRPASAASNPKLVRTSTIPNNQHSPQSVPSGVTLVGHSHNSFNPYTLYSPDSKARLHMEGDLDGVAKKWADEELEAARKIIVFNREQKGNDIFATFDIVSQSEWKNHPRSVSCIWWAEKKEAFVTSVDTILLLEGIVGARFTVEEKNRIRRNLEGFKPDTVSKAKPDTEEFFKVIMGFPNPKPRNIEKDVKVFPWKVLSVALHKIISKYSASYASTASSLQHQPKMYRPMDHHEYIYSTSPVPEYHGSLQVANFPAHEPQGRLSAPVTPVSHLHIPAHLGHGYRHQQELPASYGYGQVHVPPPNHIQYHGHPMVPQPMAPEYWHHPAYNREGPMSLPTAGVPSTAYSREMIESADYHRAVSMQHYIPQSRH